MAPHTATAIGNERMEENTGKKLTLQFFGKLRRFISLVI
jgi:hypothetical protein